jgi:hypothetical protein
MRVSNPRWLALKSGCIEHTLRQEAHGLSREPRLKFIDAKSQLARTRFRPVASSQYDQLS